MAPVYSTEAINSLSDVEKQRMVLAYLHHRDPRNVDWAAAAASSGSKSMNSFKVMFNNTLKKLQTMSDGTTADASNGANDAVATTKTSPKKRGKAAADADNDDENPAPKKRGRKKTVKKEPEPNDEQQVEESNNGGPVKAKPASESFFDLEEEY